MLDSNDRNRPVSVGARVPKTWDFMETTFVALVGYGVFVLTGWLTLVVLVATHDGAALSPAQLQAMPRGWDSAASILGCASTIVVLWIAVGMARREFSEYLALNWPTRDEVMAALMITVILWLGEIVFRSPTAHSTSPHLPFSGIGELLILIVAACIAAPIMEEFTFRGFMFRGWSESFLGPIATIVLTAAIWGQSTPNMIGGGAVGSLCRASPSAIFAGVAIQRGSR
jgi:membrane protease YdiL (CAAX protease family)